MAIAVATQTAPRDWRHEDDATLATVLAILDEQAAAIEQARDG